MGHPLCCSVVSFQRQVSLPGEVGGRRVGGNQVHCYPACSWIWICSDFLVSTSLWLPGLDFERLGLWPISLACPSAGSWCSTRLGVVGDRKLGGLLLMCWACGDPKHLAQEVIDALEKNASIRVGFSESTSLELMALSNWTVCRNKDCGLPKNPDFHPNSGFLGHCALKESHLASVLTSSSFVHSVTQCVRPVMGTSLLVLWDSTVNLPNFQLVLLIL